MTKAERDLEKIISQVEEALEMLKAHWDDPHDWEALNLADDYLTYALHMLQSIKK